MKCLRYIPILLLFLDSCIEPLPLNLASSSSRMVVDGMITNEPGPYQIKLSYSSTLEKSLRLPEPITGASVWIMSSLNESELLAETSPGIYETSAGSIQGQIGVAYQLKIITASGEYQSEPQVLVSSGNIDEIFFIFSPDEIIPNNIDKPERLDAFKLYINSHGQEEGSNLFRWRWTGVYKVRTFPEKYTIGGYMDLVPITPRPWPCSGYIYQQERLQKIGECECCICWSYNFSSTALVSDPRFISNNEFKKIYIGTVGITSMSFYERYYVEVEQLSVSKEVYDFWKLVENQQSALGSLVQPNAVKVRGNVKCLSNPDEEVLGVFSVSAISKKSIFIEPEDIPYTLAGIDTVDYDCRVAFKNSTTEKPIFW